jgi:3-oxoadipate enol-lactonase/4-carboxymuconolactone decarboxylase
VESRVPSDAPGSTRTRNGFSWIEVAPPHPAGPAGAPILLLHGLGLTRTSWAAQLGALGRRWRVAAWDLPGYGDSEPLPSTTLTSLRDAVLHWADALDADRFHLVGHSLGGMLAQHVGAFAPNRLASLTLISTSPKFGLDGTAPDDWRAARLDPLDRGIEPESFAAAVLGGLAARATRADVLAGQIASMSRITGVALRAAIDCVVAHDARALLGTIAAPTVVLVGSLDEETPLAYAQALVDAIPDAVLEVVDGAGHLLPAEAPDAVNDIIARHVETHS